MLRKSCNLKQSGNPSFTANDIGSATSQNNCYEQASAKGSILTVDKIRTPCQRQSSIYDECRTTVSVGVEVRPKTRRKPCEPKKCQQNANTETGTMAGRSCVICCRCCEPITYPAPPTPRPYKPLWDSSPRINNCNGRKPSASNVRCSLCSCGSGRSIRNIPSEASCQTIQQPACPRRKNCDCNCNPCTCCKCSKRKSTAERCHPRPPIPYSSLRCKRAQSKNDCCKERCCDSQENPLTSFQNINDEDWKYCFGSESCNDATTVTRNTSGALTPDAPQLLCAQQLLLQAQQLLVGAANKLLTDSLSQGPDLSCDARNAVLGRMSELVGNITQLSTLNRISPNSSRCSSPNYNQMRLSGISQDQRIQLTRKSGQEQQMMGPGMGDLRSWNSLAPQFGSADRSMYQKTPSAPFEPAQATDSTLRYLPNQGMQNCPPTQGFNRASSPVNFPPVPPTPPPPQDYVQPTSTSEYASNPPLVNTSTDASNLNNSSGINDEVNVPPLPPNLEEQQRTSVQGGQTGSWDARNSTAVQRAVDVQPTQEPGPGQFWSAGNDGAVQIQRTVETQQFVADGPGYWGNNDGGTQRPPEIQPRRSYGQGYWGLPSDNMQQLPPPLPQRNVLPDQIQPAMGMGYNFVYNNSPRGLTALEEGCAMDQYNPQAQAVNAQQRQVFMGQNYREIDMGQPLPNTQGPFGQGYWNPAKCYPKQQDDGAAGQGGWPNQYENGFNAVRPSFQNNFSIQPECDSANNNFQNRVSALEPRRNQPTQMGPSITAFENSVKCSVQERMLQTQNGYNVLAQQNTFVQRNNPYQYDSQNQDYPGMCPNGQTVGTYMTQCAMQDQPIAFIISDSNSAQETCLTPLDQPPRPPNRQQGQFQRGSVPKCDRNFMTLGFDSDSTNTENCENDAVSDIGTDYENSCPDDYQNQRFNPGRNNNNQRQGQGSDSGRNNNNQRQGQGSDAGRNNNNQRQGQGSDSSRNNNNQRQCFDPVRNSNSINWNLENENYEPQSHGTNTNNQNNYKLPPKGRNTNTKGMGAPAKTKSQRQFPHGTGTGQNQNHHGNQYGQNAGTGPDRTNVQGFQNNSNRQNDNCPTRNSTGATGLNTGGDCRRNKQFIKAPIAENNNKCGRSAAAAAQRLCNSCGRSTTSCECNGNNNHDCHESRPTGCNDQCNKTSGQRKQCNRLSKQDSISGLGGIIGVTPLTPNPLVQRNTNDGCV